MIRSTLSRAFLVGVLTLAGVAHGSPIPDALFQTGAGQQATFTPASWASVSSDTSGPSSVYYSTVEAGPPPYDSITASVSASAYAGGMPSLLDAPTVGAQGSASGILTWASVGAAGRVTYFLGVDPVGTAPVRSVPIVLHAVGQVSFSGNAPSPGGGAKVASGVWLGSGSSQTQWCYVELSYNDWQLTSKTRNFDQTTTIYVNSGSYIQVLVNAGGNGFGWIGSDNQSWNFSATCDPTATIDPGYAYANQYTLTMSSNIMSAPEPATLSFLALGGLALLHRRRKSDRF